MAGKVREYDKFCLNLKNTHNILALMALDTELNQLHRLCIEQGPFFKVLFEEVASDALRQGLKQRIPRQPANESHFERSYWKPTITDRQIETIDYTISNFLERWTQVYNRFQMDIFHPRPDDVHALSPLSIMNTEIVKLSHNIIAICRDLTTSTDAKGTWELAAAPAGQGETQTANCELSSLLAQLTQTDDWFREPLNRHICLTPIPYTHVTDTGQHEHEDFQDDEARDEAEQKNPRYWVIRIQYLLHEIVYGDQYASIDLDLLSVCEKLLTEDVYRYLKFPQPDQDYKQVNRLYNKLVTAIKPFYTLSNTTRYTGEVQRLLRNLLFDLLRLGGLINSERRLELRAHVGMCQHSM